MNKIEKAHILMKEGRWEYANELWREIREEAPENPVGFILGGIALKRMKKYNKALELFDHEIKAHPEKINGKIQKAHTLMEMQRLEDANELWSQIRNEAPENPEGFLSGGRALRDMKEYDRAAMLFMEINTYGARNYLFDILEKIISITTYARAWRKLIEEKFDYENPTTIALKMNRLRATDWELYKKYDTILREANTLDYYTKLALEYEEKPNKDFLIDVFKTGNENLTKNIALSRQLNNIDMES